MSFIDFINSINDRVQIRTGQLGNANQIHWCIRTAHQLYVKAEERDRGSGYILWHYIPLDMTPIMGNLEYDPYDRHMEPHELRRWLWDHVVFDKYGEIIALHNKGEIIVCGEGWENQVERFCRVRLNETSRKN